MQTFCLEMAGYRWTQMLISQSCPECSVFAQHGDLLVWLISVEVCLEMVLSFLFQFMTHR